MDVATPVAICTVRGREGGERDMKVILYDEGM